MAKTRIYELARQLNKSNKDVIAFLESIGVSGKTHSSTVDDDIAAKVVAAFAPQKEKKAAPVAEKKAPPVAEKKAAPVVERKAPPVAEKKIAPVVERKAPPVAEKKAAPVAERKGPPGKPPKPKKKRPFPEKAEHPERPEERKRPKEKREKESVEPAEREALDRHDIKAPGMKRAFKAIRKLDHAKRHVPGPKKGVAHREKAPFRPETAAPTMTAPRKRTFKIHEGMTVKEFSEMIGVKATDIIRKFMELGYMPNINQAVDIDAAVLVADTLGIKLEVAPVADMSVIEEEPEDESKLVERAPIVTIMGHVDHGKTSLLDAIRETKVIDSEAGGITQHIGAYKVTHKGKDIVFLDTPGHEAFTALRARGAKVTDIVVLIVAADDGVKPQTVEAIDHAKAAGVPIIVAINKIDKPEADVQRVKSELSERGLIAEDWGGSTIFSEISAKKRIGIDGLLELIQLQAEMMELKANPERLAKGVIVESRLDRGKGPIATIIVQKGQISIGDAFISGTNFGRVRALLDDNGKRIKQAGPSTPIEVIGFGDVPSAGDSFAVLEDEKQARQIATARLQKERSATVAKKQRLTLDELYAQIKEGRIKDLNIIIKGDVQGSVEAIKDALEGITHPEVQVKVIHTGVGGINESDVMLASASEAIIIGFNVRPEIKASQIAEREGVDIELYNIIYEAIDDVKKALEGMLEPTIKERVLGHAEVRQVFQASKVGTIAGCYVQDGTISRNSDGIRVIRDNIVVYEGKLDTLKRFKDDVKDVATGYECGITIQNFNDIKVGDVLENFVHEKIAAKL